MSVLFNVNNLLDSHWCKSKSIRNITREYSKTVGDFPAQYLLSTSGPGNLRENVINGDVFVIIASN
jgi:hypothetical protein